MDENTDSCMVNKLMQILKIQSGSLNILNTAITVTKKTKCKTCRKIIGQSAHYS